MKQPGRKVNERRGREGKRGGSEGGHGQHSKLQTAGQGDRELRGAGTHNTNVHKPTDSRSLDRITELLYRKKYGNRGIIGCVI